MNLNGDEKRIQQLFREMSDYDQARGRRFADLLAAAASSQSVRRQNHVRSLRVATAAAILCFAMLIAIALIVSPSRNHGVRGPDEQAVNPTEPLETRPSVLTRQPEFTEGERQKASVKRGHYRRTSTSLAIAMKSLSAWRSPTASLLKTPEDELLKSLPRLGESLHTIKFFSPDEFN